MAGNDTTNVSSDLPNKKAFWNFLQVGMADKIFGGKMDPVEGASWRTGLKDTWGEDMPDYNLKDYVLESGGPSKEAFGKKLGLTAEETMIDTVRYGDRLSYDFVIGSKETPKMMVSQATGSSVGDPSVTGYYFDIDKYKRAHLKEKYGDDLFAAMDDKSSDQYASEMKMLKRWMGSEGGFEELWSKPKLKKAFQKYEEASGSK
tara:strand:- start:49 stop:657 length:609 start_codon:yes stop_codon:yes gene_type:complete